MTEQPSRPPRRRLDVEARRTAILDAAARLYAASDYADVSVPAIAADAAASPALVFHYFGSKAELYACVVADGLEELARQQQQALDDLHPGASARDQVRACLLAFWDHVAAHPRTWRAPLVAGEEPGEALTARHRAREAAVADLRELLRPAAGVRYDIALWGYFGFVDQACLAWVNAGCPPDWRHPMTDAALGALEGALGDWGR